MITLLSLVKALPEILGVLIQFMKMIELGAREIDSRQKAKQIKDSFELANTKKDTSGFDKLFGVHK